MKFFRTIACFALFLGTLWVSQAAAQTLPFPTVKDIFIREEIHINDDTNQPIIRDANGLAVQDLDKNTKKFFPYGSKLRDYTGDPTLNSTKKDTGLRAVSQSIKRFLERVMVPFAVIMIVWAGISLIAGSKEDQEFTNRRNQIVGMAFGFIIIAIAQTSIDKVFFGIAGEAVNQDVSGVYTEITDATGKTTIQVDATGILANAKEETAVFAREGTTQLYGIFNFFSSFAVTVAMAFLLYTIIRMIMSGGREDEFTKGKKRVLYTLFGIALIKVTETIVDITTTGTNFYSEQGTNNAGRFGIPDWSQAIDLAIKWTNIFLGLTAFLSLIATVWAGIFILMHLGNDEMLEKGKKTLKYAIIGLILAYSSFTIISQLILANAS